MFCSEADTVVLLARELALASVIRRSPSHPLHALPGHLGTYLKCQNVLDETDGEECSGGSF